MAKKLVGVSTDGTEVYICQYAHTNKLSSKTWLVHWALTNGSGGIASLGSMSEEQATLTAKVMVEDPSVISKMRAGAFIKI